MKTNFSLQVSQAQQCIDAEYPFNDSIGEYYDQVKDTLIQYYQGKKTDQNELVVIIALFDPYKTMIYVAKDQIDI